MHSTFFLVKIMSTTFLIPKLFGLMIINARTKQKITHKPTMEWKNDEQKSSSSNTNKQISKLS